MDSITEAIVTVLDNHQSEVVNEIPDIIHSVIGSPSEGEWGTDQCIGWAIQDRIKEDDDLSTAVLHELLCNVRWDVIGKYYHDQESEERETNG